MKDYEDKKYEAWREQVEANLLIYLKKNLLTKPSTGSATTHRSVADDATTSEDTSDHHHGQYNSISLLIWFYHFFHVYLCLVVISSPLGLFLLPFDGRKLENENRCRAVCVAEIGKVR